MSVGSGYDQSRRTGDGNPVDRLRTATCSLAAGICIFASLPPRGVWPLAAVGVGLLAVALRDLSWRGRAAVGAAAGVTWFGPSLVWVAGFTNPGYMLLMCAQAGLLAAIAAVVPQGWPVASAPVVLVLAELARGRWPLGGFPLGSLAHGQVDGPFVELSRFGGPLLVVAVVGVLGASATDLRTPAARMATLLGFTVTVAALVWPQRNRGGRNVDHRCGSGRRRAWRTGRRCRRRCAASTPPDGGRDDHAADRSAASP